jgi:hypothetical protein
MKNLNLEERLNNLHDKINIEGQVKGSLLIRSNGLHISSKLDHNSPVNESRKLAANIAWIFRYFNKLDDLEALSFKLKGIHFHLKYIPSKKVIFTVMTETAESPALEKIMKRYALKLQQIL